jgi:hypothetical protein
MNGLFNEIASPLATERPISSDPTSPGPIVCGEDVYFFKCQVGLFHGLEDQAIDYLQMLSGSYLRHYATVLFVNIYLRRYQRRKNMAIFNDGHGRFIAGTLYG